jgi:hypothetical protein
MNIENMLLHLFIAITTGVASALFVCGIYYLILKIKGEL